jgi:hypothetical protein
VIGAGIQKVPGAQGPHGWLTELNVTGGQPVVAAAVDIVAPLRASKSVAVASALHGIGAGKTAAADNLVDPAVCGARVPLPVSSTFVSPSGMRVKVNFGQTFNDESKVLKFIVIVPVEAL